MVPTILEGDYTVVNKLSYGYGKYSFPIKFPIKGRIFGKMPKRGDVIAFKTLEGDVKIQRIVGIPNDKVQVRGGLLYLNEKIAPREFIETRLNDCKFHTQIGDHLDSAGKFLESLPRGVVYEILDGIEDSNGDNTGIYVVPQDFYFVMGDNRDEAIDSRFKEIGFVSSSQILGKVNKVAYSMDEYSFRFWEWLGNFRWSRFFKTVK